MLETWRLLRRRRIGKAAALGRYVNSLINGHNLSCSVGCEPGRLRRSVFRNQVSLTVTIGEERSLSDSSLAENIVGKCLWLAHPEATVWGLTVLFC